MISATYTGTVYDSTSTTTTSSTDDDSDALGQDSFLKMFLAQVTNQDPLNPMDNTEFTAQLATFSQLEQLTNINENLESLWRMESAIQQSTILGYVGRNVTISGNSIPVSGGVAGSISYDLDQTADVRVIITDESGTTIRTEELGLITEGRNTYEWDGKDLWGNTVDDGTYTISFSAYDNSTGDSVAVTDLTVSAMVTGYEVDTSGDLYLIMGDAAVPAGSILGVRMTASELAEANGTSTTDSDDDSDSSDTTDTSDEDAEASLQSVVDALNAAASAAALLI